MRALISFGIVLLTASIIGCASETRVDKRVLDRKGIERGSSQHRILQSDLNRIRDASQ